VKRIVIYLVAGLFLTSSSYGKDLEKKELKLAEKLDKTLEKCGGDPVCEAAAVEKYQTKLAKLGICVPSTNGSIVIVPGAAADAMRDTSIELRNSTNFSIYAHCFYADVACTLEDFQVSLPPQGTLQWTSRAGDLSVGVPPVPLLPFAGELVCIEVDSSGFPISGNHLAAAAGYVGGGDVCLSPISIPGFDYNNSDATLCLGDDFTMSAACPTGPDYAGCPAAIDRARIEGCWSNMISLPDGSLVVFLCDPFN
jgi:hypothetical protein